MIYFLLQIDPISWEYSFILDGNHTFLKKGSTSLLRLSRFQARLRKDDIAVVSSGQGKAGHYHRLVTIILILV